MLISDEYRQLNAEKHATSQRFGVQGYKYVGPVSWIINQYHIESVLDYGCGKASLKDAFPPNIQKIITCYDPCIKGYDKRPDPAELVTCTDVLEHVEPEFLDNVLDDISYLSTRYAYFNISLVEANKHLPDGRNAHLNVYSWEWWIEKLRPYFVMTEGEVLMNTVSIVCRKKNIKLC